MTSFRFTPHTFVCFHRGGFYFRVRGVGLSFEINRPMLFSERHGFRKVHRLGNLAIEVLRKC